MNFTIVNERHPLSIHVVWMFIILFIFAFYKLIPPGQCLFHEVTGFPCLSCGATRAANNLFEGDIPGMIYYNPLLVLFCGGLFFYSLFKFLEYILKFRVRMRLTKTVALTLRIMAIFSIFANWLFLIVTGR